jgi:hypothetical protein
MNAAVQAMKEEFERLAAVAAPNGGFWRRLPGQLARGLSAGLISRSAVPEDLLEDMGMIIAVYPAGTVPPEEFEGDPDGTALDASWLRHASYGWAQHCCCAWTTYCAVIGLCPADKAEGAAAYLAAIKAWRGSRGVPVW